MKLSDRKGLACDLTPTMKSYRTCFGLELVLLFIVRSLFVSFALLGFRHAGRHLLRHFSLLSGFLFSVLQTEGQRREITDS